MALDKEQIETGLLLDEKSIHYLGETRKWTLFLSIVALVVIFLLFAGTLFYIIIVPKIFETPALNSGMIAYFLGLITVISIIYFFPIYFLLQFSKFSRRALEQNDQQYLAKSFKYLKYHFQYIGILIIIVILFYLVIGLMSLSKIQM